MIYFYDVRACDRLGFCRWCDRGANGALLGESAYCGNYDECWFGQVGHLDPYTGVNVTSLQGYYDIVLLRVGVILCREENSPSF